MEHTKNVAKAQLVSGSIPGLIGNAAGALNVRFLDEDECIRWIIKELHSPVVKCPRCGAIIIDAGRLRRFWSVERLKCEQCGAFFTALTGTVLSGCHMSLREIYLMLVLLGLGVKDKIIADKLNVSQESIRLWRKKLTRSEQ